MKTLHFSIVSSLVATIILVPIIMIWYQNQIQSEREHISFEEQFGNPTQTWLAHDGAILILNQTSNKLEYKAGENITISAELINLGNKSVDIGYWTPLVVLEIKNQDGVIAWPENTGLMQILEFYGVETIRPGEHLGEKPWGHSNSTRLFYDMPLPQLHVPGKYTVVSVALFTFNTTTDGRGHREPIGNVQPLWSKPTQITVLPR